MLFAYAFLSLAQISTQTPTVKVGTSDIIVNPDSTCELNIADAKNAYAMNTVPNYKVGDFLKLTVTSNCNLFIYLFNIDSNSVVNALPNARGELVGQGQVFAHRPLVLPDSSEGYLLRGTTGYESMIAVGTTMRLDANDISQFAGLINDALSYYHESSEQLLELNYQGLQASDWTTGIMRYSLSNNMLGNVVEQQPQVQNQQSLGQTAAQSPASVIIHQGPNNTTSFIPPTNQAEVSSKHEDVAGASGDLQPSMQLQDAETAARYANQAIVRVLTIPGATVLMRNPAMNYNYPPVTESNNTPGEFIQPLPPGEYTVQVTRQGYLSQAGTFRAEANYITTLDMLLIAQNQTAVHPNQAAQVQSQYNATQNRQQYATVAISTNQGATVYVTGYNIYYAIPESTTTPGSFSFLIPPGDYVINVAKVGYASQAANISVAANETLPLNMLLVAQ